jgi:hypothetical protein
MLLNRVQPQTVAGKLTARVKPHALLRSCIAAPLLIVGVLALPSAASAAESPVVCPNVLSRVAPSLQLPDCRGYEQVSPHDANIDAEGFPGNVESSSLGERVRYWSVTPFPIPGSCALDGTNPNYISSRGSDGAWSTEGVIPCGASEGGKLGFSEDLSETVVWATGVALTPGAPLSGRSYYLRYTEPPAGMEGYRLLATVNGSGFEENYIIYLAGISGNDEHLIFETKSKLLAPATGGAPNTYEIDLEKPEDEQLSLVGVLPADEGGEAPSGGSVAGEGAHPWESFTGHVRSLGYTQSAISQDGSRVFFTALPSERVYLRENPWAPQSPTGAKGECTVVADACTVAVSPGAAHFRGATPDGAHAFYSEGEDLYRYDTETGATRALATPVTATAIGDLTAGSKEITNVDMGAGEFHVGEELFGKGLEPRSTFVVAVSPDTLTISYPAKETLTRDPVSGSPGGVLGVLGASGDGRTVYFVASGVLATNPNSQGETAANEPEIADLYESYQPTTGPPHTTFIARLANIGLEGDGDEEDWNDYLDGGYPVQKSSRVTSDGQTLLFAAHRSLTGYNNGGGSCGGFTHLCQEFYRYRAGPEGVVGRLTCVSCNPKRATPPVGETTELEGEGAGTHETGETTLTRNLSENGKRVFFQTQDALVEGDTNGQTDVYEWEADGEGTCRSEAQNEGCLYLISSGTSNEQSYFGDASANGNNVFFFTRQALTPTEAGNNVDVYDARVCEAGEPCETSPPACAQGYQRNPLTTDCEREPCYTAEECKPPSSEPPPEAFPATAAFNGPGNLVSPPTIEKPPVKTKTAAQLRAEKLAKALKLCDKKPKKQRARCEKTAKKRYGPLKKVKAKKK